MKPSARLPLPAIPVEVLREAHTLQRAWVSVDGYVYDLTSFASRHPGGSEIIGMAAGKDVTALFNSYHRLKHRQILSKYIIGSLAGSDTPQFPPPDDFSKTVRQRADDYFSDNHIDPKHSPTSLRRYTITIFLVFVLYTLQWSLPADSFWLFYLVSAAHGFALTQYCISAIHDASHGAIGHDPRFWKFLTSGHDLLNGCSSLLWTYQHVLSHHIFTNIDGFDTDIDTDDGGYRRIKSVQRYMKLYKLQYLYAPMLYALLGMAVRVEDIGHYISGRRGPLKVNPLTLPQNLLFWGGKIFFFTTRIAIPLLHENSIRRVLGAFFVADFVFSVYLAMIFQATHVVEEVAWPQVDEHTGVVDMDWGRLQVETAQDYAHGQPLTTLLCGSLNYQVVHHLFPNVAQEHLLALAAIVRSTAEEFGVRYVIKDNLWSAIGGHIGLLQMMGNPPHSLDG